MNQNKLLEEMEAFLNGESNTWDLIFDNRFMGVIICDEKGDILKVNHAHRYVTGLLPEELVGREMAEFVKIGLVDKALTPLVLENKKPILAEQHCGGKSYLVQSEPMFNDQGDVKYVISFLFDVSIERILRTVLENAKDEDIQIHEKLAEWQRLFREEGQGIGGQEQKLVYQSKAMEEVLRLVERIADSDAAVLITGESGVGKELIAREIHKQSKRKDAPFVSINCGAIPEGLLESELFGYEAGAFTHSNPKGKEGLFEVAGGGTIFLDEIGEMSPVLQVKLLRVLQENLIRRVGGIADISCDVRVISATNADLDQMIQEHKFRKDLFYRLNVIPIHVPSLAERREDIPLLACYFLNYFCRKHGRVKQFTFEALKCLMSLTFEGNVRELQNTVERLVLLSPGESISVDSLLPAYHLNNSRILMTDFSADTKFADKSYKEIMEIQEKELLSHYNEKCGSTYEIARILKVNQSTVWRKMKKYKIVPLNVTDKF